MGAETKTVGQQNQARDHQRNLWERQPGCFQGKKVEGLLLSPFFIPRGKKGAYPAELVELDLLLILLLLHRDMAVVYYLWPPANGF